MSGITVLVWLLYAANCVQFGTGLLMDDTVESSIMSRLDSLEKLLAEEKQLRMNITANAANLNSRLNEEQRMRVNLTASAANLNNRLTDLNSRLNEEQRMRMSVTAILNEHLTGLNTRLVEEQRTRANLTAIVNGEQRLRIQLTQELDAANQRVSHLEAQPTNSGYPAFMAVLSTPLDQCTPGQHVIFDAVKYNEGGAYNSDHGVFTAPVAGTYMFTATLSAEPNNYFNAAIVKNSGDSLVIGYLFGAYGMENHLQHSTTAVTHLDANDDVWMKCRHDSRIYGSYYHSHMSGVLISPDA